jgi:putative N6-adenine-specific DNA methylase
MRIGEFKAADFQRLEDRLDKISWELYFYRDTAVKVQVSTRHCRLYHTDAIAERFLRHIRKKIDSEGVPTLNPTPQKLFVRGEDNRFTVSIDSSGDALYKRGIKMREATAPVRETLAAGILMLSGYTGNEPLIDPMCGSGTFSLEAALISKKIPPGWHREFAFMGWPCFESGRWKNLRKTAQQGGIRAESPAPAIVASDKDPAACLSLSQTIEKNNFLKKITVIHKDFFDYSGADLPETPGIVVINPPYGLRQLDPEKSRFLFCRVLEHLGKVFTGWKAALVIPEKYPLAASPIHFTAHRLHHGGLAVLLMTGMVSSSTPG